MKHGAHRGFEDTFLDRNQFAPIARAKRKPFDKKSLKTCGFLACALQFCILF
jgi:hypothetical protein